ncbi:MAG: uroporphyrinogen decarboxylase family protein [Planctomycetia bacterium]|nr:uroporphyrinogen decarboxylase family protein [Planctomycetia bacterium]
MKYDVLKCPELDEIVALVAEARDDDRIERGKRRMAAVSKGLAPDYLPLCFSAPVPRRKAFPTYNMREQFYNREAMLVGQLSGAVNRSDAVPSVRPNLGVGFIPSLVGVESIIFDDMMPWPQTRLSKQEIADLTVPDDVSGLGMMPRCLELIEFYAERLGGVVEIFIADTQGPLDIAHLIRGSDIFTDFYDDPPFIHHLLRLSTELYVKATMLMLEATGQPEGVCYHSGTLYAEGVRARMCNDTDTLLSGHLLREFVEPYVADASAQVGNVWSHYCGRNPHLEAFLENRAETVHGINFGNPEMQDFPTVMSNLIASGKFYFGGWPRNGELLEEHFTAVLTSLGGRRRGLILNGGPTEQETNEIGSEEILDLWHRLQDKYLSKPDN